MFSGLFFEFLTPLLWGFVISQFYFILMIFSALDVPIRGVQFFLDNINNGALPLDLACHE
jgi:hypothetical protein